MGWLDLLARKPSADTSVAERMGSTYDAASRGDYRARP
jgi:hypothetical protein